MKAYDVRRSCRRTRFRLVVVGSCDGAHVTVNL